MSQAKIDFAEILMSIVKPLCVQKDHVKITSSRDDLGVLLSVRVHPDDMGSLIGKDGNMAHTIRDIIRAVGFRNSARISLKIEEPSDIL